MHLLEAPGRRGTRNAGLYGSLTGNCMKKLPNTAIAALQKVQHSHSSLFHFEWNSLRQQLVRPNSVKLVSGLQIYRGSSMSNFN